MSELCSAQRRASLNQAGQKLSKLHLPEGLQIFHADVHRIAGNLALERRYIADLKRPNYLYCRVEADTRGTRAVQAGCGR